MRSFAIFLPLLIIAVIIDALLMTLTHGARIFDPFLVIVVAQAPHGRKTGAILSGAVAGLIQDMLASVVFGIHFLSKVVIGYSASLVSVSLIPGQPLTALVLLGGGTIVEVLVQALVGALLGQSFVTPGLGSLALSFVLNVGIGMPAIALINKLARRRTGAVGHARGR